MCMCMCVRAWLCMCMCVCAWLCMCMCVCMRLCVRGCACVCVYVDVRVHVCVCVHVHACIHLQRGTHSHVYMYITFWPKRTSQRRVSDRFRDARGYIPRRHAQLRRLRGRLRRRLNSGSSGDFRDCVGFDDPGDSASSCGNSSRHGGAMTTPIFPDEFGYRASPSACEAAADDVDWPQQGGNRFRQLLLLFFFDLSTLR